MVPRPFMGQADLFAKRTFTEETEQITGGAITWQESPELRLGKMQSDGLLFVHQTELLTHLPAPWPEARRHEEILTELKLAAETLDRRAVERALLRRQMRQVQRVEQENPSWLGHEPLWLIAPYLPEWLGRAYVPARLGPGCYRVDPFGTDFLWIAANELPLQDELVPFLIARSGEALDEFGRWVVRRRPREWVLAMLKYLAMSTSVREELLLDLARPEEDPELSARQRHIVEVLLATNSELREQLLAQSATRGCVEGRQQEARAALRCVLTSRKIPLEVTDEARIDACSDLEALRRWLEQALTASSAREALS
ncbi:hypothetical protein [Chondromyces crocatus]|uniref:Uncharacterized protein n=1 Tax=Chondromyces crocatus TaxID=52 RepID=A0A0K1E8B2_CHOCO|nr:hypothetical protein [Chondromyces crocatus]AKT37090.1 uncharacterized protein CMC5_012160 [Chondromyces crocatus]